MGQGLGIAMPMTQAEKVSKKSTRRRQVKTNKKRRLQNPRNKRAQGRSKITRCRQKDC